MKRSEPLVNITVSLPGKFRTAIAALSAREQRPDTWVARNLLVWAILEYERREAIDPAVGETWDLVREAGWLPPASFQRR